MNKLAVTTALSAFAFALPALADDAHHPDKAAEIKAASAKAAAKPAGKPVSSPVASQPSMAECSTMMQGMHDMHEKMMAAKTPEERHALMAEHMKIMQDGMAMMGNLKNEGQMRGKLPADMAARQQMMEKRMEMMESMLQMMMDRLPAAPAK